MIQKMNKIVCKIVLGVFVFCCVGLVVDKKAEAIVDVRVGYAFGNLNVDGSKVATEKGYNFQLLFQPIILLPVGLGASYMYHKINASSDAIKDLDYERISLDAEVWLSLVPLFTPFAGVSFIPWQEFDDEKVDSLKMGYTLKAGVKVNIIPLLNAFLDGEYSKFKGDNCDYSSLLGVIGVELDL